MEITLNDSLVLVGKEIGHQFKVEKTTSGKFSIDCQQADYVGHGLDWAGNSYKPVANESLVWDGATAGGIISKEDTVVAGNNNNYISSLHYPLCHGAGVFRTRCYRQVETVL